MFCKLKAIVVFSRIISDFIGLRSFGRMINDYLTKYEHGKMEKLSKKIKKAEQDISFLTSCERFTVCPKL